ncbi:MAG: hypothetical protein PHG27_11015, partial [Massilibacteroides sp.]|nr:hypothetical protein [Massilibacteroides sp.]
EGDAFVCDDSVCYSLAKVDGPFLSVCIVGYFYSLSYIPNTSTKKKLHSYSFVMEDSHHFMLNVESEENFIEGEFFRIATAPDISPVSVWAEKNKINPSNEYDRVNSFYTPAIVKASYKLPAVLHFPDYGLIQIEANENEVYLQEHIVPDETNTGLSLGPYNRSGHTIRKAIHHGSIMLSFHTKESIKEAHLHFTVLDENYPHLAGCDLSDKKYNGLKRCWQNVFTLNPNNQTMGDNILLEGVGHLSLPYKADLLPFTPELTGSFTMREALKRSIEIALQERIGADGRIIDFGWECTETTQIAIYDYLISTNNWQFIKQYLPQIKQLVNGTLNADIDHDGIIESPFSGNQYSSTRSSWNWWDDFAFGYKDAYTNLMAYRGLTCMHKIFFKLGLKAEADSIQAHLDLFKKNFHNTFFNPVTGMYAGWISRDGEIHDYQFTFISSTAINLGLVPHKLSFKIMKKMLKKMKQEGYDYKYGIPGPLVPVDPKDKGTWEEMSRWGRYENGGLCGQTAYHFIQALYKIGMRDEADTILFTMLNTFEKEYTHSGVFPGYLRSVDWRTKGGEPTGYNYLADNYYFLLAAITGHFNIPFPELKEPE